MADQVFGFGKKDVQRIVGAVKAFERTPTSRIGPDSDREPRDAKAGCWAKLGASAAVSGVNHYAWTEQRETTTGFDDMPSGLSGTTTTSFAINDRELDGGSASLTGTPIVWLRFEMVWDSTSSKWVRGYRFSRLDEDGFWAQITGATLIDGENARWAYTFAECTGQWTATGRGQLLPGGRTGTAYNTTEAFNPTSGIGTMGSGNTISSDEFDNDVKEQPIHAGGPAVWVRKDNNCLAGSGSGSGSGSGDTPTTIYLFEGWNKKAECPS